MPGDAEQPPDVLSNLCTAAGHLKQLELSAVTAEAAGELLPQLLIRHVLVGKGRLSQSYADARAALQASMHQVADQLKGS